MRSSLLDCTTTTIRYVGIQKSQPKENYARWKYLHAMTVIWNYRAKFSSSLPGRKYASLAFTYM